MAVFDDPGGKLRWLEEELLEEEELSSDIPSGEASMEDREAVYVERKREKGIRRLKFLAFLEVLGILAILWGWIQWLYGSR